MNAWYVDPFRRGGRPTPLNETHSYVDYKGDLMSYSN